MADKNIYTVLVADDEDELREAVCTMIPWEALGFHLVGNASNGLDALELVDKYRTEGLSHKAACKKAAADTGFSANELYDASLNE